MTKHMNDSVSVDSFLLAVKDQENTSLITRAEEAMNGMLVLNGTGPKPVFVGIPPRWEENPCGVAGYTWTMSRLKYMVTLCKAYLVTGQQRYLDKVEVDLNNWLDTVPAPPVPHDYESACYYHCVHNWRMLEVGFRMVYTYPTILSVLRLHGKDRHLVERIYASIAEHAKRISAGSHLLWPGKDHNHYTEEINGLLSAASMIPEHPRSEEWVAQAIDGLEHACASQLTNGGSQTEGSAEYHAAVVINFCYSIFFARKCGKTFSPEFVSRVKNGLDFAIHTAGPDCNMLPFGDSDQKLYTPFDAAILSFLIFNDAKHLTTLRQFADVSFIKQQLSDRFPWGFPGIAELLCWLDNPLNNADANLLPTVTYQRQMDQYIYRTDWSQNACCLFFSCNSPIHPGSNHAHMDQLGIIFGAHGKILLQDPGRYTYKDCEDRHLYKSSQVHNVPTVNGEDAFEYLGIFAYGPQKDGAITGIMDSPRIQGAQGYHNNYDPVQISRSTALLDGKILLIADTYNNIKGKCAKTFFHLNSTCVSVSGNTVFTEDSDVNIHITAAAEDSNIKIEVLDGRLSDVFYHDYPSKRAVIARNGISDSETLVFAAVAYPAGKPERIEALAYQNGIITFAYNGTPYQIRLENGNFLMD